MLKQKNSHQELIPFIKMEIINNETQAKEVLRNFSEIALVPTMGNLHSGHVSLVNKAKEVGKIIFSDIRLNDLN